MSLFFQGLSFLQTADTFSPLVSYKTKISERQVDGCHDFLASFPFLVFKLVFLISQENKENFFSDGQRSSSILGHTHLLVKVTNLEME